MTAVARWLNKIVFVALLVLIVLAIIPYGTVDAWWEAIFECLVFILTAAWIFEALFRGSWQIKRASILLPLVLITVYAFCQAVDWPGAGSLAGEVGIAQHTLSIDRYQTLLTARKLLALTLFLGLLLLHVSSLERLRWLVRVSIGLGLASALFGILRQLSQPPNAAVGFVFPFLYPGVGYGHFISANVFAYLMEMVCALLAGLILGKGLDRKLLPIYAAIAVIVWAALILSSSRGGVFGFVCAAIFLAFVSLSWYAERHSSASGSQTGKMFRAISSSLLLRVAAIVLIVITLALGIMWMGGERLNAKMQEDSTQDLMDGTARKEIWRASWELVKRHPLTGVGFGAFYLAIPEYQIGSGRIKLEQAHNDYLDLLANGGLIAFMLAGWFLVTIVLRVRTSFESINSYRRAAALGAVAGMFGVAVHSLVDFGLQVTGIAVFFGVLLVISVAEIPRQANS